MFDDEELRGEIQEMFGEEQERYGREVTRDALYAEGMGAKRTHARGRTGTEAARGGRGNAGFRVFIPNPPKTEARKASMRRFEHQYAVADIKARLLAGERPKLGGRGRPPTRWFEAAAQLGIDIGPLPVPKRLRESKTRAGRRRLITAAREAAHAVGLPPAAVPLAPTVPEAPDSLATVDRSTDRTSAA